ncbi:methyl-accepting chemotaxis protein, partial [Thiorhodococcus fuscus]
QNASASEELAATAEEMSGQAEQLQQMMSFFKTGVESARPAVSTHRSAREPQTLSAPKGQRLSASPMLDSDFVSF